MDKIDKWLLNKSFKMDRALLVTTTAGATSLDNLNNLLNEWGLSADTNAAVEEQDDTKYYQSPFNIYTDVQNSLDLRERKAATMTCLPPILHRLRLRQTVWATKQHIRC
jgi:hypothetical protein